MSRIAVSVEIDAPPAVVWAVAEQIERHVDWMTDAERIDFETDQTRGVGTRFTCATTIGPLQLDDRMEITEWEPEQRMGVRHEGLVTGAGTFTLTPIDLDRRTRFDWAEELRFPWWLGGPVGGLIGGNLLMKTIWRRNLGNLKRIVEAAPAECTDEP